MGIPHRGEVAWADMHRHGLLLFRPFEVKWAAALFPVLPSQENNVTTVNLVMTVWWSVGGGGVYQVMLAVGVGQHAERKPLRPMKTALSGRHVLMSTPLVLVSV